MQDDHPDLARRRSITLSLGGMAAAASRDGRRSGAGGPGRIEARYRAEAWQAAGGDVQHQPAGLLRR